MRDALSKKKNLSNAYRAQMGQIIQAGRDVARKGRA